MSGKLTKSLISAITLAEITMLLALAVLEWYSGYRAGLMHHLYFKKRYYLATVYQPAYFGVHLLGVAASLLAVLFFCRSGWSAIGGWPLLKYGVAMILLPTTALLPWFSQLTVFAHLLLVLELCLVLETLALFSLWLNHRAATGQPS